jgi:rSAM/selenodomain-associated transferase 1
VSARDTTAQSEAGLMPRDAGDETIGTAVSHANPSRILVQVFAKAPVPGEVKTRLAPLLGAQGAAELYCRLVQHTLATVTMARVGNVEVWVTAAQEQAFLQACQRLLGVPLLFQPEGDLGARMSAAMTNGLERASAVLLVGCDVPTMSYADLREARDALAAGHHATLGPAEDGGYWLIGLTRHAPELFTELPWSTPALLDATRERLRALRWRWHELPTRWDVDRPEDVHRLAADGHLGRLVSDLL